MCEEVGKDEVHDEDSERRQIFVGLCGPFRFDL